MTAAVMPFVIAALAIAMALALLRVLRGPSPLDRVLALDTLYVCTVALLVALGIGWRDGVWFEAALLVGMLGFIGTLALARHVERGKVIE